jgi:hypothetical protein
MARKQFFVSPNGANWKVTSGGTTLSNHQTQATAIRAAVDAAHRHAGDAQVMVQRPDGTFRTEWTYGHDPYPPRG